MLALSEAVRQRNSFRIAFDLRFRNAIAESDMSGVEADTDSGDTAV